MITYSRGNTEIVENVPDNAKITFGKITPGSERSEYGVRIYTTQQNQLAVFANAVSFRDLSLVVKRRQVRREIKPGAQYDPLTGVHAESDFIETEEWVEVGPGE